MSDQKTPKSSLTPVVKSEGVIPKDKLLRAIHGSSKTPLVIGDVQIPCYVLETGQRVLSGGGMQKVLGYNGKGRAGNWLVNFANQQKIKPHMTEAISSGLENRIPFVNPKSKGSVSITYGYEATLLIDICDAIIEAKNSGDLKPKQLIYARNAEIIMRSVAKVGIVALVDEATGYQDIRPRDALQRYLDAFLLKEYAKWAKRFPDEFFESIFKMKGWSWEDAVSARKPQVVGRYINEIVYDRLAPKILDELRDRNPPNERGNRKAKHHQFLTPNIGHPKLQEHLTAVMGIQRIAGGSWRKFQDMLDKAFPRFGHTLPIMFSELDDDDPQKPVNDVNEFDKLLKNVASVPPPKKEPNKKSKKADADEQLPLE